jgi:hypothetical protein
MNNKVNNYTKFVSDHLHEMGIKFVIEQEGPTIEQIKLGEFGYYSMIITEDATGILSDSTDDGDMLFAISFHKVDEFVDKNILKDLSYEAQSFITMKSLKGFIDILSNKRTIKMFVHLIKDQIKKNLDI